MPPTRSHRCDEDERSSNGNGSKHSARRFLQVMNTFFVFFQSLAQWTWNVCDLCAKQCATNGAATPKSTKRNGGGGGNESESDAVPLSFSCIGSAATAAAAASPIVCLVDLIWICTYCYCSQYQSSVISHKHTHSQTFRVQPNDTAHYPFFFFLFFFFCYFTFKYTHKEKRTHTHTHLYLYLFLSGSWQVTTAAAVCNSNCSNKNGKWCFDLWRISSLLPYRYHSVFYQTPFPLHQQ